MQKQHFENICHNEIKYFSGFPPLTFLFEQASRGYGAVVALGRRNLVSEEVYFK